MRQRLALTLVTPDPANSHAHMPYRLHSAHSDHKEQRILDEVENLQTVLSGGVFRLKNIKRSNLPDLRFMFQVNSIAQPSGTQHGSRYKCYKVIPGDAAFLTSGESRGRIPSPRSTPLRI